MTQNLGHGFLIALAVLLLSSPMLSRAQGQPPGKSQEQSGSLLRANDGVPPYKAWLEQDVVWIITDGERAAFKTLKNDEERELFVEAFWVRRDPTPETYENEYKEEHYRRIVFANDHFGSTIPGWKSERGRFYIMWGPPDDIESYATKAEDKGSSSDPSSYPLEVWHYRYRPTIRDDVVLEFVDKCKCGDYRMPMMLVREKDARSYAPEGLASRQWGSLEPAEPNGFVGPLYKQKVRSKDLEEKAIVDLAWKQLPFEVVTDSVKATEFTSLVSITITFQKRDIVFEKDHSRPVPLNILGRVTSVSGRVEIFETTLTVDPSGPESDSSKTTATAVETLALRNGGYRVEIAAQQAGTDRWGRWAGSVKAGN
jgi:GWxTD domain-containing protein